MKSLLVFFEQLMTMKTDEMDPQGATEVKPPDHQKQAHP